MRFNVKELHNHRPFYQRITPALIPQSSLIIEMFLLILTSSVSTLTAVVVLQKKKNEVEK